MAQYARETEVPAERTRNEIESTLQKYGATSFGYGWQSDAAIIVFEFKGRRMKFVLPLPGLFLSIKAKLVTVDDGISTVETEFMGHIILPNGMTVSEWMHPQIESAYRDGKMPPLLGPGLGGNSP